MYASIRRYKVTTIETLAQRVQEGFVPLISALPGFVAYYVVDGGDGMAASVSVFKTQAGAEESNRLAAEWARKNIAELIASAPETTAGEVIVHRVG